MRALIVIPTYNERENISSLVEEIIENTDASVLIVDDDSPDGTGEVADLVAQRSNRVEVLHRPERKGLGPAYRDGFARALTKDVEVIVQMDADYSHQPRYLPRLFEQLDRADVVIGSRYVAGGGITTWGAARRGVSWAGNMYARGVLDMPYTDVTTGFVAFRRHVLEAIDLDDIFSDGYAFQIELKFRAHRLGFTIVEVPIVFYDRVAGRSKLSRRTVPEALMRVAQLRFRS